ncbi:MAG: hypothetical protein Q4A41_02485 [Bacillota bacterium]|nr:hypothetical protein [Bacillota bacterium]
MYYGVKFGDLWREALKDDEGCYSPRNASGKYQMIRHFRAGILYW